MILPSPSVFLRPHTHTKTRRGGDQGRVDTGDVIHTQYNQHTGGGRQRGDEEGIKRQKEKAIRQRQQRRERRGKNRRMKEGVETRRCEGEERTQKGGRKLSL